MGNLRRRLFSANVVLAVLCHLHGKLVVMHRSYTLFHKTRSSLEGMPRKDLSMSLTLKWNFLVFL